MVYGDTLNQGSPLHPDVRRPSREGDTRYSRDVLRSVGFGSKRVGLDPGSQVSRRRTFGLGGAGVQGLVGEDSHFQPGVGHGTSCCLLTGETHLNGVRDKGTETHRNSFTVHVG